MLNLYVAVEIRGTVTIDSNSDEEECNESDKVNATLSYTYKDPSVLAGAELTKSEEELAKIFSCFKNSKRKRWKY